MARNLAHAESSRARSGSSLRVTPVRRGAYGSLAERSERSESPGGGCRSSYVFSRTGRKVPIIYLHDCYVLALNGPVSSQWSERSDHYVNSSQVRVEGREGAGGRSQEFQSTSEHGTRILFKKKKKRRGYI